MAEQDLDGQSGIYERLEHGLALSKLINHESLANLLERFGEFLRVGLVAADADGTLLGSARDPVRPCRLRKESEPCPACADSLPGFSGNEKFVSTACRSGVIYLRARIDNQFEAIGHLIVGPFAAAEIPIIEGLDSDKSLVELPRLGIEQAREAALLMCTVLEEVVFANYQSYLFSKMHLQLSRDNLQQVTDPSESPDNTILDSGEFSSLF